MISMPFSLGFFEMYRILYHWTHPPVSHSETSPLSFAKERGEVWLCQTGG